MGILDLKRGSERAQLVSVSWLYWIEVFVYSLLWGAITFCKNLVRKLFQSKDDDFIRGNPPSCLTDSSLGSHLYIKLKGVKLHYVVSGEKNNPLVILLHGFPDCWITWRYQIPELSQNFRVVAVDLKGFGDSDKPDWRGNYSTHTILQELQGLIQSLLPDRGAKCIIIGHDIGALLGWFLIHLKPDMISKFVALAAPHPNLYWDNIPESAVFNTRWVQFCQLPNLPESQALEDDLKLITSCFHHLSTNSVNKAFLDAYKYTFARKEDWIGPLNYFRNLPFVKIDCKEKSIEIPSLIIVGNKDINLSLDSIIRSTEYTKNFTLKVVEGASHFLHQQRPYEVNKLILQFLLGNQTTTPAKNNQSTVFNRVFNSVSSTVKYGNGMIDAVQKTTNGIVAKSLFLGHAVKS